jgi:hypothetical protein
MKKLTLHMQKQITPLIFMALTVSKIKNGFVCSFYTPVLRRAVLCDWVRRREGVHTGINRVLPLPQGKHVAKFGKDPIYRTKVIVQKRSYCQKFYIPFDKLYRQVYFVMHTFLVSVWYVHFCQLHIYI